MNLPALAAWAALVLTGILTGTLASRWNAADRGASPRIEQLLLAAAATSVVAWFANAGALISGSRSNTLLSASVPIVAEAGFRLAVLWATLPGAALTFAVMLLVGAALSSSRSDRVRSGLVFSSIALLALGLSIWFAPTPDETSTSIPTFLQSAPAALAPLFALLAVAGLAAIAGLAVAGDRLPKGLILVTWLASTSALASEQLARSQLGIGPRDAVLLGSASSGLILWLVTGALLHGRTREVLLRVPPEAASKAVWSGRAAVIAHVGAALVVLSFLAHVFAARSTVSVTPGAAVGVSDPFGRTWQVAHQGVSRFDANAADVVSLAVEARDPSGKIWLLTPEIQELHGPDGRHFQNSISRRKSTSGALQAMRVLLLRADSLDVASIRVTFLPFPLLWPVGVALLVLSAILAASVDRRSNFLRE